MDYGFVRITPTRTIPILYPTLKQALKHRKPGERVARATICYPPNWPSAITIAVL